MKQVINACVSVGLILLDIVALHGVAMRHMGRQVWVSCCPHSVPIDGWGAAMLSRSALGAITAPKLVWSRSLPFALGAV